MSVSASSSSYLLFSPDWTSNEMKYEHFSPSKLNLLHLSDSRKKERKKERRLWWSVSQFSLFRCNFWNEIYFLHFDSIEKINLPGHFLLVWSLVKHKTYFTAYVQCQNSKSKQLDHVYPCRYDNLLLGHKSFHLHYINHDWSMFGMEINLNNSQRSAARA